MLDRPVRCSRAPMLYGTTSLTPSDINSGPPIGNHLAKFDLTSLPLEIIDNILINLSQFDLLRLCRTCYKMHELCNPFLYHHIIIDPQFNIFANEYRLAGRTYINSSFNLKRFIKTFNKTSTDSNHVYSIHCKSLPESLNLHDHQLKQGLVQLFGKLRHLNSLIWLDDQFSIELLKLLPQKHLLNTLVLNLNFCSHLIDTDEDVKRGDISKFNFPNLINFQIKPFQNWSKLIQLIDVILINVNDAGQISKQLQELSFSGQFFATNVIETIFLDTSLQYLSSLTSLSLNDSTVTTFDAKNLSQMVDLSKLKFLQLRQIIEMGYDENLQRSFLIQLSSSLLCLRHLSLEIEEYRDTIAEFLLSIPPKLTSLDIFSTTEQPIELAQSIAKHNQLKKLSCKIYLSADDRLYNAPPEFYSALIPLNLTSLRICSTANIQGLVNLLSSQRKLKYLDIVGANHAGAPNLGFGMVHPTVYDEWYKVQHEVLFYLSSNSNMEYIRYDDCIFQCKPDISVNPRGDLNTWFEEQVRVFCTLGLPEKRRHSWYQ